MRRIIVVLCLITVMSLSATAHPVKWERSSTGTPAVYGLDGDFRGSVAYTLEPSIESGSPKHMWKRSQSRVRPWRATLGHNRFGACPR